MNKKIKIITALAVIIRRLGLSYLYFTIFNSIEKSIQTNQETQYESLIQRDIDEADLVEYSGYNIPKSMLENDKDLVELVL